MPASDRLQAQIRRNLLKSALLLAGFPLVLPTVSFAAVLTLLTTFDHPEPLSAAAAVFLWVLGAVVLAMLVWVPIGYVSNQWMIEHATGARLVGRHEERRLWEVYENLGRSADMRLPALRIIETEALNAFASGLSEGQYSVTVTRGLLEALDDAELEAVLAHELAHIRNNDCRMMVVATILVGLIPIVHDVALKIFWVIVMTCLNIYRAVAGLLAMPLLRVVVDLSYGLLLLTCKAAAYAIGAVGLFCATLIHFSLSRQREFLADAGAVEMTGNPDALISALRKVACNSEIATSIEGVRELLFESHLGGLFATHPPIERRIAALERFSTRSERPDAEGRAPFTEQPQGAVATATAGVSPTAKSSPRRIEPRFEQRESVSPSHANLPLRPDRRAVDGIRRLLMATMDGQPERLTPQQRKDIYIRATQSLHRQIESMPRAQQDTLPPALAAAIDEVEREAATPNTLIRWET